MTRRWPFSAFTQPSQVCRLAEVPCTSTMRQRVVARAFVAQVHDLALHVDEVRRRRRPARHQRLDRPVGRTRQRQRERGEQQQHAEAAQQPRRTCTAF